MPDPSPAGGGRAPRTRGLSWGAGRLPSSFPPGGPAWPASVFSYDVYGLGAPFHRGHGLPQTLKRGTLFPGPYFWSFTDGFQGAGTRVKSGNSRSGNSLGRIVFACCCRRCFPLREPSCRRPLRGPAASCPKTHSLLPGPPKPPGQTQLLSVAYREKKELAKFRSFVFHNTRVFQNILFIHSKLGSARAQSRLDKQKASHRLGILASATGQRAQVPAGPRESRTAGQSGVRGLRHREPRPGLGRCLHAWAPRQP